MRVLHVCHQYWPTVGGAERYVTELSEELAARGHHVDVYTSRSEDYMTWSNNAAPAPNHPRREHAPLCQPAAPASHLARARLRPARLCSLAGKSFFEPFMLYGNGPISPMMMAALLRNAESYDLVHITSLHYAHAWTAFNAARLRGVPVALTPLVHIDQPETFDVGYMRRILQNSQLVFAVTEAERDFLERRPADRSRRRQRRRSAPRAASRPSTEPPPAPASAWPMTPSSPSSSAARPPIRAWRRVVEAVASLRTQRPQAMLPGRRPRDRLLPGIWASHRHADGSIRARSRLRRGPPGRARRLRCTRPALLPANPSASSTWKRGPTANPSSEPISRRRLAHRPRQGRLPRRRR